MTERVSPRPADVRVGSTTDGLTPISVAERQLGATWPHWAEPRPVALAALGADQLTKAIVTSRLDLNDEVHVVGPFSIHHVTNSGIAFGLFASATSIVILLTSARGRVDALLLRPLGRASSRAARSRSGS